MIVQPTPEELAELGLALVPIAYKPAEEPDGKPTRAPLIPWREIYLGNRRPLSPDSIRKFAKDPRLAAWAMICGRVSGRAVFDYDRPTGPEKAERWGIPSHVQSKGNGRHHHVIWEPGMETRRAGTMAADYGPEFADIELKSDGSLCHVLGIHEKERNQWLRSPADVDRLADVPEVLRTACRPKPRATSPAAPVPMIVQGERADWTWLINRALARAGNGSRNDAGYWLACQLHWNDYRPDELESILYQFADRVHQTNTKGQREPYTHNEARATVKSVLSKVRKRDPIVKGYGKAVAAAAANGQNSQFVPKPEQALQTQAVNSGRGAAGPEAGRSENGTKPAPGSTADFRAAVEASAAAAASAAAHTAATTAPLRAIVDAANTVHVMTEPSGPSKAELWAKAQCDGTIICTKEGTPKTLLSNALTALRLHPAWDGVLAFNTFKVCVETKQPAPWGKPAGSPWGDNDDRLVAVWLQQETGIHVGTNVAGEAVQVAAADHKFHPVRDYLDSLEWDGTPRIDDWVNTYLGADNDPERPRKIARTFGRLWLIAAVARIYEPGCKADNVLILEGKQGLKKSSALEALALRPEWFTDRIEDFSNKDSLQQIHGVWIVEFAELDAMSRAETAQVKAFITAKRDRFRLPYGKNVAEFARDNVFAGSVNGQSYLRDETGNRRFWPILCTRIDLDALIRDRDQLWAEAVTRYRDGAEWWLEDRSSLDAAEAEQQERYDSGPWTEVIADWLEDPTPIYNGDGSTIYPLNYDNRQHFDVTIGEVLAHCLKKHPHTWTRADQMQVAGILQSLGYERFMVRRPDEVVTRSSTGRIQTPVKPQRVYRRTKA